jgi:hypothetical protein
MPIENFEIEQEQEQLPVNLLSRENRNNFLNNEVEVGDMFWVSVIWEGWGKGLKFKAYSKPFLAQVTHVRKGDYPSITFETSRAKSKNRNLANYINNYGIVHTTEQGCIYLHDQKLLQIAQTKGLDRRESIYRKLINTPPPEDTVLIEARNWLEGLTEQEKEYVKKLIWAGK